MTTKIKGRSERHDPKQNNQRHSVANDPLEGRFALASHAKESRINRQQKRCWKHKYGGAINLEMAGLLILAAVVGLMLTGVI